MKQFDPTLGVTGLYFANPDQQWSEFAGKTRSVSGGVHLRWATSVYAGHPENGFDLWADGRNDNFTGLKRHVLELGRNTADFSNQAVFGQLIKSVNRSTGYPLGVKGTVHGSGDFASDSQPLKITLNTAPTLAGIQITAVGAQFPETIEHTAETQVTLTYANNTQDDVRIDLRFLEQKTFYLPLRAQLTHLKIAGAAAVVPRIEWFENDLPALFAQQAPGTVVFPNLNITTSSVAISDRINLSNAQLDDRTQESFDLLEDMLVINKPIHSVYYQEEAIGSDTRTFYKENPEEETGYLFHPHQLLYQAAADAEAARALGLYTIDPDGHTGSRYVLRANFETDNLTVNGTSMVVSAYGLCDQVPEAAQNPVAPFTGLVVEDITTLGDKTAEGAIGNRLTWTFDSNEQGNFLPVLVRLDRKQAAQTSPIQTGTTTTADPPAIGGIMEDPGFIDPTVSDDPVLDLLAFSKRMLVEISPVNQQKQAEYWDLFNPMPTRIDERMDYSLTGYDVWGRHNVTLVEPGSVFRDPVPQAPGPLEVEQLYRDVPNGQPEPTNTLRAAFYWRQDQHDSDHKVSAFEVLLSADLINGISTTVKAVRETGQVVTLTLETRENLSQRISNQDFAVSIWGTPFANHGIGTAAPGFSVTGSNTIELSLDHVEDAYSDHYGQGFSDLEDVLVGHPLTFQNDLQQRNQWNTRKHQAVRIDLNQPVAPEMHEIDVYVEPFTERVFVAIDSMPFSGYSLTTHPVVKATIQAGSIRQFDKEFALETYSGPIPKDWAVDTGSLIYSISEVYDEVIYYLPEPGEVPVYPRIDLIFEPFDRTAVSNSTEPFQTLGLAVRAYDDYQTWSVLSSKQMASWVEYADAVTPVGSSFPTSEDDLRKWQIPMASEPDFYGKSSFDLSWNAAANTNYQVYRVADELLLQEAFDLDQENEKVTDKQRYALANYRNLPDWRQVQLMLQLAGITTYSSAFSRINDEPLHAESGASKVNFTDVDIDGNSSGIYVYKLRSRTKAGIESDLSDILAMVRAPGREPLTPPAITGIRKLVSGQIEVAWMEPEAPEGTVTILLEDRLEAPKPEESVASPTTREPVLPGTITIAEPIRIDNPTQFLNFQPTLAEEDFQREDWLKVAENYHWRNSHKHRIKGDRTPLAIRSGLLDLGALASIPEVELKGIYLLDDFMPGQQSDPASIGVSDLSGRKNHLDDFDDKAIGWLFPGIELPGKSEPIRVLVHATGEDDSGSPTDELVYETAERTITLTPRSGSGMVQFRMILVDASGLHHSAPGGAFLVRL